MLDRAMTIEKLKGTRQYLSEHYGVSSMMLFYDALWFSCTQRAERG